MTAALDEWLSLEEDLAVARARERLLAFMAYIYPGHDLNWHHRLICRLIDEMIFGNRRRLIVSCPPRHGKALADNTPMLTPEGWTTHGELREGDKVYTPFGGTTRVVAVSEPCVTDYAIHFDRGDPIICNQSHLWAVQDRIICQTPDDMLVMSAADIGGCLRGRHERFELPKVTAIVGAPPSLQAGRKNFIVDVTAAQPRYGRCIQVGSGHGMYLAGHECIPTHNSEIISRLLPAFLFGLMPDLQIIACSYSADLAQQMNRDVQRIIDSEPYHRVFPQTVLNASNIKTMARGNYLRNSDVFEIVGRRGRYRGAGLGQGITGMGADWLLIDDALKDDADASSKTIKDGQWEWYSTTARTRLHKNGRIAILMTRWCDDDLPGRLIESARNHPDGDQWDVVNLPAINEEGPSRYDPRPEGEALWPDRYPVEALKPIKVTNQRTWQALYQGNPVPPEGNILKKEWWRFYAAAELPLRFDQVIITCDLTFKDGEKNDYVALQVFGKKGGLAYLLDQVRQKMEFVKQVTAVFDLRQRWIDQGHFIKQVIVEAAANGEALISALRPHIPSLVPMHPGRSSKFARAEAQTPIIQAGNLLIPSPKERPWVTEYMIEWERFPYGRHDDQVDATVMALKSLFPQRSSGNIALPVSMAKQPSVRPYS